MTASTVNIVPRDDNEGKLGTARKQWGEVNAYEFKKNGKTLATLEDCNQSENYLKRDTAYKKGAIATSLALPTWAILECSLAGTTATEDAPDLTVTAIGQKISDGTAEWVVRHKLDGHSIGDIWMFKGTFSNGHPVRAETGLPMLDVHLCDGTNGTINMTNRFPMGTNVAANIGTTGGANSKVITAAQMPVHTHGASAWTDAQGNHAHVEGSTPEFGVSGVASTGHASNSGCVATGKRYITDAAGAHGHNIGISIANAGGNAAFDVRPAYATVAFVQKIY